MKTLDMKKEIIRQTICELTEDLVYFATYDRMGNFCNFSFGIHEAKEFAERDDLIEIVAIWGLMEDGSTKTFYGALPSIF